MSNIKVSSDIDTLLRKSTKQEVATFLDADNRAPLASPEFTGNVGINKANPANALDVVGNVDVTGQIEAPYFLGSSYIGGTASFTDTSVSGDLQVYGDISITGDINLTGGGDIEGDLTTDDITSDASITATALNATVANIGIMDIDTADVEFQNSDGSVMLHVNSVGDGVTLKTENKAFIKENCYNKDGSVRLQKAASDSEEILLRYEGPNSDNFVIQQWHGGNQEGQIKFLGDTPEGSNTIRLDAKNVDIGKAGTVLTKIFSDTNIVSNKKLVFTDTRTKDHGLQFNHSGTGATVQMGMYGSHGDADKGEFKLTHTDSSGDTNVLVVDAENDYTLLSSPKVGINTTSAPTAALDVNGTIRGTDLNINSKGFFVKAGTNGDYLQAKDYGHGDFHDLADVTNQPKSIPAFGNSGKLVEKTLIKTFKLQGTAFTGLATPVVLVTGVANKYIVPIEMSVYCDYGTRTGTFGNGQGGQSAIQIGTFQNEDNTPSGGGFAQLLAVPVSTANTQGKWLTRKSAPAGNELKQFANRDLVLKSNNVPSSEANAPDGTWYIQLEYMILDEYESFENNVDSTIGTAF